MKPVMVISHERSGTHLCMNLIALNFGLVANPWIDMPPARSNGFRDEIMAFPETIRKSHHQVEAVGNDLDFALDHYTIVYVVREVCAVMVSCWHYFRDNGSPDFPKPETFDDFLKVDPRQWPFDAYYSAIPEGSMVRRWKRHTQAWLRLRDRLTVLTFRELIQNPELAMWKVATAIGFRPSDPITIPPMGHNCICFRRGVYGSWKDEITIKQQLAIEKEAI